MQEALETMAVKEKQGDSTEEIDWNVENEVQLFFAMNGHKPVGEKMSLFIDIKAPKCYLSPVRGYVIRLRLINIFFLKTFCPANRCQQVLSHGLHLGEISCSD